MVRRAQKNGFKYDYLLIDSWFLSMEVVKTITGLKHHVLGMLKSNINSFTVAFSCADVPRPMDGRLY